MSRRLRLAAAQYDLVAPATFADWAARQEQWVSAAVGQGAELLVFPEYGAMELAALTGRGGTVQASFDAVSEAWDEANAVHRALAMKHGVTLVSGSGPQRRAGQTHNVAHVFGPRGRVARYDKIMPTPWERNPGGMAGGRDLMVFDTGRVKVGLVICYDIEFPLLARALAEAGAEVILAPSNTESDWGYWRVRSGAMARALENQCYVVQVPTVGASDFAAVAMNVGAAGVFAPSDQGFPAGGVVALGEMNRPGWVHATLDLDLLAAVRVTGNVQTFRHWAEQPGAGPLPAAGLIDMAAAG
jgi:predicted amidohydrolase